MTDEDYDTLGAVIAKAVKEATKPLAQRIADLEARTVGYKGVWQAAQQYNLGDLVTDQGALWHCNASTRSRPGTDKTFTLAVKQGGGR